MRDLSIKELVTAVSNELLASQAEREAEGRQAIFEVSEMTFEISFVVTDSTSSKGGFDIKVIKADAGAKYEQEETHKVTLRFKAGDDDDLVLQRVRPRLSE